MLMNRGPQRQHSSDISLGLETVVQYIHSVYFFAVQRWSECWWMLALPWTCPGWPGAGAPQDEESFWDWTPRCLTGWWRLEMEFVCHGPPHFIGKRKEQNFLSTSGTSIVHALHQIATFSKRPDILRLFSCCSLWRSWMWGQLAGFWGWLLLLSLNLSWISVE